ncbi:hypothetical protein JTB14_030476 [Gonioctena quinquepunctata]|nr:hypothetical protein JTB14_030476 [Gonioctena quinquepunctata]
MGENTSLVNHLKVILGNDVSNDIVSYIKGIEHEEDYAEFMENILDKRNSAHLTSFESIRRIIFGKQSNTNPNDKVETKTSGTRDSRKQGLSGSKKRKTKFKDINSYQTKKKEKEGRSICDCLGQEHEFMNNCLDCGRIHCMEEGPGPCLFCGNMISVRGDEMFDANSRRQKAIMKPKENKVFDDDNDYFKINSKKNSDKESKQKMVIALDFATRRVIHSTQEDAKIRERLLEDSVEHLKKVEEIYKNLQKQSQRSYERSRNNVNEDLVNLLIQMRHKKPVGVEEDLTKEDSAKPIINYGINVFDEELMATMDHGLCLSMHQPYASLLIAGVKKHEGRTWPTDHRGRLWIAAAARAPEDEEIDGLEAFYRELLSRYIPEVPKGLPDYPYVLICSSPIILPIFYPIVGKHKIYALEKDLHKCAKLALQHAKYIM